MKANLPKEKSTQTAVIVVCVALGLVWLSPLVFASPALLPPLNTLTPYPTDQATPVYTVTPPPPTDQPAPVVTGATIELRAAFPVTWPWETAHWGTLWTVVQWQDEHGDWHDVEGWRGELDAVEIDAEGQVVGFKNWWVAPENLGTGPFRWRVFARAGGPAVATSDPFDLPATTGQIVTVEVTINP